LHGGVGERWFEHAASLVGPLAVISGDDADPVGSILDAQFGTTGATPHKMPQDRGPDRRPADLQRSAMGT
jgi:hypothetical protein